jgi:hypothetical protein
VAQEILYSGLGDQRLTEILDSQIQLILADRGSFFNHPAIVNLGDKSGLGSTASKVPLVGLDGYDVMGAINEGSATSNTAFTDASAVCTVARQALQYQMSDLARGTDSLGITNHQRFAQSLVVSGAMRLQDMLANLVDNFATVVGTTTVDLTLDDYVDATISLDLLSVPGPYLAMLHPRQYGDFRNALLSAGGAVQWMDATAQQLQLNGQGFKGSFLGVDIVQSSKVPTANGGADRAGGMFGRGALAYATLTVPPDPFVPAIYSGMFMIEFERDAAYALSKIVGNMYAGAVEVEDLRGVSIITDA